MARNGQQGRPAPSAPVAVAGPFPLAELVAIRHALSGSPPNHLYAGWMAAARRVAQLLEGRDGHP